MFAIYSENFSRVSRAVERKLKRYSNKASSERHSLNRRKTQELLYICPYLTTTHHHTHQSFCLDYLPLYFLCHIKLAVFFVWSNKQKDNVVFFYIDLCVVWDFWREASVKGKWFRLGLFFLSFYVSRDSVLSPFIILPKNKYVILYFESCFTVQLELTISVWFGFFV